jgi:hypothetical protein
MDFLVSNTGELMMKRRIFLAGLLPFSYSFAQDQYPPDISKLVQIHGNLIQNFKYEQSNDTCGKIQCKRSIAEVNQKNQYGKYYGNCRDYNILLSSKITNQTKARIQTIHCYKDNRAHAVCFHPASHLVFDNFVLLPITWEERTDLSKPTVLWDSAIDKLHNSNYKQW